MDYKINAIRIHTHNNIHNVQKYWIQLTHVWGEIDWEEKIST